MAKQPAIPDNSTGRGLLVQDSTGTETRQVRSTLTNPNAIPVEVLSGSSVTATPEKFSSAPPARIAVDTSNATLASSNSSRKKIIVAPEIADGVNLYVKFGATATAIDYTYILQNGDVMTEENYTGRIDAILATGSGFAQVTEG